MQQSLRSFAMVGGLLVVGFGGAEGSDSLLRDSDSFSLARAAASQNTAAGLGIYRQWAQVQQEGNLVFSPSSALSAFGLLHAGTRGDSLNSMSRVFGFPTDLSLFARQRRTLQDVLKNRPSLRSSQTYELNSVNDIWSENSVRLREPYQSILREGFEAKVHKVDFENASESSRRVINDYLATATRDRIKDLLPPGSVRPDTRLVLTNAVYFLADWQTPFPAENTGKATFTSDDGTTKEVDMMTKTAHFARYRTNNYVAVSLPYVGNSMAMLVVVPSAGGVASLEKGLNATQLEEIFSGLESKEVRLRLPKFTIEPSEAVSLKEVLMPLGLTSIFCGESGAVDLTGMAEGEDLCVSAALQKAFVKVDEKGTEAAAATGIVVGRTSLPDEPPEEIQVNHSSLFAIYHKGTHDLLFVGRLWMPQ